MKKQTSTIFKISIPIIYTGLFFLSTFVGKSGTEYLDIVLFSIGLTIGIGILFIDEEFVYKYYSESKEQKNLVTRSLIFILSLLPLGLFLMTSTGSAIGIGMFLAIVSGLSIEILQHRVYPEAFQARFLSQLKRELTQSEIDISTLTFVSLSLLFGVLTVFFGR